MAISSLILTCLGPGGDESILCSPCLGMYRQSWVKTMKVFFWGFQKRTFLFSLNNFSRFLFFLTIIILVVLFLADIKRFFSDYKETERNNFYFSGTRKETTFIFRVPEKKQLFIIVV